ncbi:uncharacterized protein LOC124438550 [Xenia sp. Carnegie-2017]|uniref:uncharacterized protein LOC124438550 n=1 Tax=Xenia sp. Carnegie-2017 TaxID=2897299 RepID=UPI001F0366D7|nr:uncharacterized protein LOC124438550 [Xenia sp. Carnegie-2017]XP_046844674.1 uncharacterized protein LOC124438550 [Xenia sp. Carnegie-2017]XP_046844675.1 uncharacterized protein LOC124438550 [Xenia sp. Carnegie-2017]
MELCRLPKIKVNTTLWENTNLEDLESRITYHEIVPACKRHTVYKIYVHSGTQGWLVVRRYSEFYKLRNDLKKLFPLKEFIFPPKRYFGDNFEPRFLNNRKHGLQGFLYMITRQHEVLQSLPVADFLCLNNPRTALDNVQQCKVVITQLESELFKLKTDKDEHTQSISSSNDLITDLQNQKQALLAALRYERQQNGKKHYPGDDLSLMFEYRSLPKVSRVDVSGFFVRKLVGGLTRNNNDKTRKEIGCNKNKRIPRDDYLSSNRSRANTPPLTDRTRNDARDTDYIKKVPPYIDIKSPKTTERQQLLSSEDVMLPQNEEFKSFYEMNRRRKSMPGAIELHKVNNNLSKNGNHCKIQDTRSTKLFVPDNEGRPRSLSSTPGTNEDILELGLRQATFLRVANQINAENSKGNQVWSSLKDLRKMKTKL